MWGWVSGVFVVGCFGSWGMLGFFLFGGLFLWLGFFFCGWWLSVGIWGEEREIFRVGECSVWGLGGVGCGGLCKVGVLGGCGCGVFCEVIMSWVFLVGV